MPTSTISEPNKGAEDCNSYETAWKMLFAKLPKKVQTKVLDSKGCDAELPPEVDQFIKNVIALAEQDDK